MNLRSIDLNLLTIFDAIVSEGNLTHAADRIGMSQPAISAALGRLRITLNDELFISTGRGVKPTQRALQLQEPVRFILDEIRSALSVAYDFDPKTSDRQFSINSIDYGGVVVIPRLLRYLQGIDSSITINVSPDSMEDSQGVIDLGSADLAISSNPVVAPDFECRVLRHERPYCLVHKQHPEIAGSINVEQFEEAKHVLLYSNSSRGLVLDAHLLELGVRRVCGSRVPSFFNMPYMVTNSDMICTMPRQMAEDFAQQFGLQAFAAPFENWSAIYYLIWHGSLEDDSGHRWLRDTIFQLCPDKD